MTDTNGHPPRLVSECTVRITEAMADALAASAEWRRTGVSVLVRDAVSLYLCEQARHLLRSGHPSAMAELREGETPEAALEEVERQRAALLATCFEPAPPPPIRTMVRR